jgi:O-methyltransferase involved in polyketide biosynthesis
MSEPRSLRSVSSPDAAATRQPTDIPERAGEPPSYDTGIAHPARVYDYLLGGKENYAADRAAAEQVIKLTPDAVPAARANRAFLRRAVRYLAGEAGIRQFLDIGTGLPTADNTHEVAQQVAPESRVAYVDNDPIVLAHGRALLDSTPQGATAYIQADARDTGTILSEAAATLDFSQPVAVLALMVLHYIPDDDAPEQVVAALMDAVPPGSYLAVSAATTDIDTDRITSIASKLNKQMGPTRLTLRTRDQIARYFDGTDLVEPGLVHLPQWRATADPDLVIGCLAGVGRKR